MERPLLLPLVSLLAGLSAAGYMSWFFPRSLIIPLVLLLIGAIWCRSRVPFLIGFTLLLALWGNLTLQPLLNPLFSPTHLVRYLCDTPLILEGIIDERPQIKEKGCTLLVEAEKICTRDGYWPASGKIQVSVGQGRVSFASGDRVRFLTRLNRPRNFLLPGALDYERRLALRNVYVTAFVPQKDDVVLIRQGAAFPLRSRLDRVSFSAGSFIDGAVPPVEASILRALLLGDQGGVPRSLQDGYSRSGVSHILSISGFHVGIISLVVFQLLYRVASRSAVLLLHSNLRRIILVLTLPVMVFYLSLTGGAPATARSVIMLAVFILALAVERETDPLDSLLIAAVIILSITPVALFDISFQLSFLALWGLIVLTPIFMKPCGDVHGFGRKVLLFVAASAGATAATIVPVAFYFHRFSITGLAANFLIVPLLGYGAVVLGFLALPFIPILPVISQVLLTAAAFLVWCSNKIILTFARFPVGTFFQPEGIQVAIYLAVLLAFTFIRDRRFRLACCSVGLILFVVPSAVSYFQDRGKLLMWFLSVGQGESTLIKFSNGKIMLVDGGGNPAWGEGSGDGTSVGERLIAPTLWKLGVSRIDYLVLSHPHPDHLQGLLYIAETFPVGEVWEGSGPCATDDCRRFASIVSQRGIQLRRLQPQNLPVAIGKSRIEFPVGGVEGDDANELSLVFRLVQGEFSALFTGDIGLTREKTLAQDSAHIRCSLLKVPHHGSRYSSSEPFLDAVSPQVGIISVGSRNSFHLPSPETLDRLKRRGIRVFRTDEDGTMVVSCDDNGRWSIRQAAAQIR